MDDNDKPILYGVSHLDGMTLVPIAFDSSTRAIMVDETTTIAFDPALVGTTISDNDYPIAMATSSDDDKTARPWVVNASTGAVLIDS